MKFWPGFARLGILSATIVAGAVLALEVEDIRRVNISSDGAEANDNFTEWRTLPAANAAISANGEYAAFNSQSDNLVPNDTNGSDDVFVHNLVTGETHRVNIASDGTQAEPTMLDSRNVRVSDVGDVAFSSTASNLVPDDTNQVRDVFVHILASGETRRVSTTSSGAELSEGSTLDDMTPDGRYVVFTSRASEPIQGQDQSDIDIFLHDLVSGETTLVSVDGDGEQLANGSNWGAEITADGRYIVFNASLIILRGDIYVKDRATGDLWLVSLTHDGGFQSGGEVWAAETTISDDGRYVVFASGATNLVPNDTNDESDIFLRDRGTGITTRIFEGGRRPRISGDGRFIAFEPNVCTPQQIFVLDRNTGQIIRVSVGPDGRLGDADSGGPTMSQDGRRIAFSSAASDLVDGDTNTVPDAYVAIIGDGNGPRGTFVDPTDTDADSIEDDCDHDDDNDGMPDSYELSYGLNSLNAADAHLDPDADGLVNLDEYRARTDPTDPDTDDDGVLDGADAYPLDPNRWAPAPPPAGPPPAGDPQSSSGGGGAIDLPWLLLWLACCVRRRRPSGVGCQHAQG